MSCAEMDGIYMAGQNNRKLGTEKEFIAAAFLEKNGLRILTHSYRKRQGEIDLVATDGHYLVFVEVKYRNSRNSGDPLAAVSRQKQRRICKMADFYRMEKHLPSDMPVRYDVVGICTDEIIWIQNAFWHIGT